MSNISNAQRTAIRTVLEHNHEGCAILIDSIVNHGKGLLVAYYREPPIGSQFDNRTYARCAYIIFHGEEVRVPNDIICD